MHLNDYIDLYTLLQDDRSTRQERRAFGLVHEALAARPLSLLQAWIDEKMRTYQGSGMGEKVAHLLYHTTLWLTLLAFAVGIFSGIGLLSYNGHAPVNLIYFLAMVVFLPLVTMTLALLSMLRANRTRNTLVHLSPAYWMERLVLFFTKKEDMVTEIKINPMLLNWIVIQRSQLLALAFSVGLLLALLGVVATRDVAFAWSTTLQVDGAAFHRFLELIALPWKSWLPSAVPSLELVQQSQYYRLGGGLSKEMIDHAAALGAWWKFLAMATLFYAVALRVLFYLIATWGLKKALHKAVLALEGVEELLRDMTEPLITTSLAEQTERSDVAKKGYERMKETLLPRYDVIQGWAIPSQQLSVLCEMMHTSAPVCVEVGGNNTLEEDQRIVAQSSGKVLLFVKAWEPPTMDLMDHLEALSRQAASITVVPVGTAHTAYTPKESDRAVWMDMIAKADLEKVWIR